MSSEADAIFETDAKAASADLEKVEVPEWKRTVWVRMMSSGERDLLEGEQVAAKGTAKYKDFRAKVVVKTACTQDGVRIFQDSHILRVSAMRAPGVDRVFDAACRVNRLLKEDIESLEKN